MAEHLFGYNFPWGESFWMDEAFSGAPRSGPAPLTVVFQADPDTGYRFVWDFGDGDTSAERNPAHTYLRAGLYTVSLTITRISDAEEGTLTFYDYISVTDNPIELISSQPDFCFKLALKPNQGQGLSPITGKWVWPALSASTIKGHNNLNENITLVLNAENMQFYQIGIPECWVDREGAYDEAEIDGEVMLPEILPRAGIHENVRHVETHVSLLPWDERTYRGADGYDSSGLRSGQEMTLEAYKNGEQIIPDTSLVKVNKDGDYAFFRDIEAKRLQLKLKFTRSAYRVNQVDVFCQELANRTTPGTNNFPQKQYQRSLALPDLWLTKNKPAPNINRADGEDFEGDAIATNFSTGTAIAFEATDLEGEIGYAIGDFTLMFWSINAVRISFDAIAAEISGGIFSFDGTSLEVADETVWTHYAVVRSGTTLSIFENGLLKITAPITVKNIGGAVLINGIFFDLRRHAVAVTDDAIVYYVANYQEFVP